MKIVEQQSLLSFRYYFCHFNLMTLPARAPFVCPARVLFLIPGFTDDQLLTSVYR
jgi:hypothetical protein